MQDKTLELIAPLDASLYVLLAAQDRAPKRETMLAIGGAFGTSFPEDFIAHSTGKLGGLYIEVKEEFWPRPEAFSVGPFWSFLYGLFVYGASSEIPDFMNLRLCAETFRQETGLEAVPFLKIIGNADVYCFDSRGKVVRWDHEQNRLEAQDLTFFEVLEHELGELEERRKRKLAANTEEKGS